VWEYALNVRFLSEITVDEVNKFAANWLAPTNRVVTLTAPDKPGLVLPTEAELRAVVESVSGSEMTAREETLSDAD
jgi:zinc protease